MHLDLNLGYWGVGAARATELLVEVEDLGYRAVWVAESYGSDAVSVLAWVGAMTHRLLIGSGILQIPARTPAMTAMTAATLDDLSGGRFLLGLGVSGPQVVEGWHGVAYGHPLVRTREFVEIVRRILARQSPLVFSGDHYEIPYRGEDATGLGKPLRIIGQPHPDIPIFLAAIGPRNVSLTAEIADGWLPVLYSPERSANVFAAALSAGRAVRNPEQGDLEVVPSVQALVTDDLEAGRLALKPALALYIGGMGAKGRNFYNDLVMRYGYDEAATKIQDLYLSGQKQEAVAAVPDQLVDELCLVGPAGRIRDRLEAWQESGVSGLAIGTFDLTTLRTLAELAL
ncbi:MAG TPA: LLM class F420-dependent oxidoreductase [Acidimicrobiia bacterium]|nr:LLM class F420-dependent oxidoreductase [Acidimicrobiia bacterium]